MSLSESPHLISLPKLAVSDGSVDTDIWFALLLNKAKSPLALRALAKNSASLPFPLFVEGLAHVVPLVLLK